MSAPAGFHSRGHDVPPPAPLHSSTVILVRDRGADPFQVFLMQRHRAQKFMGGAYVFPGGKLDPQDEAMGERPGSHGLDADLARRQLQEPDLRDGTALGLFFTAVRETFEEAGVLLARDSCGDLLAFREGETAGRYARHRLRIYEKKVSLGELAAHEGLTYALDLLVPYAHWITPEVESRRFDTRFFLCRHPSGQAPFHANLEMTRSFWTPPADALREHEAGRLLLMPPTLKTLEELSAFATIEDLFSHATRRTIHPIMPEAFSFPGGFGVRLPHDPEYTTSAYKQPHRPGEPSRIVMQDGRWQTRCAE